ncbi:diguanylate cyclase (GGDEF)-like protein/PAS domain S-box-containing protein [Oceanisphaera litoralis]|uniref:GGDEF domain-containing protein n=1 Tax=Oceanisphaera litoralis TaxID=225144 RepID=UPI0019589D11|nr:sensor domain-containing diguanylate cyclase [Oceanisphaera litoralis]MBM7454551.1 diguanylate cyclase (GGDEF)-like protein/PAS domain S-box-containing protein [Oceanisphaera litoralis]
MSLDKLDAHAFHFLVDMLGSVEIGLVVLDLDFRVQLWNGFMENHSGLTSTTVRDKNLFSLFPDLPQTWLRRKVDTVVTLKTRAFTSWELRPYLFRFGTTRPVTGTEPIMYQNLTISPLAEPDGNVKRVCLMIYDVTDVAGSRLALEQANKQLARLSITDNLTGLLNRGAWENLLDAEFCRYQRYGHTCSLILIDIDNFKSINDQYGHPAGDEVIRHLAATIRGVLRSTDQSGRYGGEEFGIILPETDTEGAVVIAERLRRAVEAAVITTQSIEIRYTISSGIATLDKNISHTTEWLRQSDTALYAAKRGGKNRVELA